MNPLRMRFLAGCVAPPTSLLALCMASSLPAQTYLVTNLNDSGPGSLAFGLALAWPTPSLIRFDGPLINSTIVHTPGTQLIVPPGCRIDGDITTNGSPDITVDGAEFQLDIGAELHALNICNSINSGVSCRGGGNTVDRCFVHGNTGHGIYVVTCSNVTIGPRNAIGNNGGGGVSIEAASNVQVFENIVGADPTLSTAMPNDNNGAIGAVNGSSQIRIGPRNTVVNNNKNGIVVWGVQGAVIEDNLVGLLGDPMAPIGSVPYQVRGNQWFGINLGDSSAVCVVRGNHVAGNGWGGVSVGGQQISGIDIDRNRLGVDPTTQLTLPGNGPGIDIRVAGCSVHDNQVRGQGGPGIALSGQMATANTVLRNQLADNQHGVLLAAAAAQNLLRQNTMVANHGAAVIAWSDAGVANRIEANSFQQIPPGQLAIDLGADGPTANDTFDLDHGPNELQNFPVLYGAIPTATGLKIYGVMGPQAGYPLVFEFHESTVRQERGEGTAFATATLTSFGEFAFDVTSPVLANGHFIAATATDINGNTSEMSPAVPVGEWTDHGGAVGGSLGKPICTGNGTLVHGATATLSLSNARPASPALIVVGLRLQNAPLFGGILVPDVVFSLSVTTSPAGASNVSVTAPPASALPLPTAVFFQFWILDPTTPYGLAASNGLSSLIR